MPVDFVPDESKIDFVPDVTPEKAAEALKAAETVSGQAMGAVGSALPFIRAWGRERATKDEADEAEPLQFEVSGDGTVVPKIQSESDLEKFQEGQAQIGAGFGKASEAVGKAAVALADIPSRIHDRLKGLPPGVRELSPDYVPLMLEKPRPKLPIPRVELTPAEEELAKASKNPLVRALPVTAGIVNSVSAVAEGLIQPESGLLLPALGGEGMVSKAAALLFGSQQLVALPDEVKEAVRVWNEPSSTTSQKVEALARPGVGAAFAGFMLKHGLTPRAEVPKATPTPEPTPAPAPVAPTAPTAPAEAVTLKSPAIRHGETPIEGNSHPSIRNKVTASGDTDAMLSVADPNNEGFTAVDANGKTTFLNRKEAMPVFKKQTGKDVIDPERGLTSEDMKAAGLIPDEPLPAQTPAKEGVPDAKGIREDQGQLPTPGVQPGAGKGDSGANLESEVSKQPQPVAAGEAPKAAEVKPAAVGPGIVGMGGATPAELTPSPKTPTGIKNAQVDVERAQRGLPPAIEPARRGFGQVWDQAMAVVDRNPGEQDRLIAELSDKPRAITDTEDALLLQRQIDLQNEYGKAARDLAQAHADGRMEDVATERVRLEGLGERLLELYNVNKTVGTATGRGLNARKMMAYEDFSLANMVTQLRVAKGGAPLTDAEVSQIADLQKKIQDTQKAHDDYVAGAEERIRKLEADKTLKTIIDTAPKFDKRILDYAEKFVVKMESAADAAKARILSRWETPGVQAGPIDPALLDDLAIMGSAKLARIGLDLAKWTDAMVKDLGERFRPFIDDVWKASNAKLESALVKVPEPVKAVVKKTTDAAEAAKDTVAKIGAKVQKGEQYEISPLVQKLARHYVETGIVQRDALIDAVHSALETVIPGIERREVMDAISGYGRYKLLTKDQISVTLRDLKGQMQQVAKLEDMQAGQAPSKTGIERRTPSDEERRLIKEVNEAKRRGGFAVTDPETQLRSALQSRETYYTHRISDLKAEIAAGERRVKTKTPSPTSPKLEALKSELEKVTAEHQDIFGTKGLTDAQRVERAIAAAEKSEAEYRRRIAAGELETPPKVSKTPETPELLAARAKRDAAREELQLLKDAINPKKTPEQIALQAYKTRTRNRIAELEAKMAAGDFTTKPRRVPTLDNEAQRLKAASEKLKQQWNARLRQEQYKNRAWWEKTQDTTLKWRRGFVLSGVTTLGKLTSAAVQRMTFTPIEELIGTIWSKLPVISKVSEMAPIHGAINIQAEAKALTAAFTKGLKDSWEMLKTGQTQLDVLYGKGREGYAGETTPHDKSVVDFFGHLHGALKVPVKRAHFARAFEKLAAWNIKQGVDVTDPLVQTRMAVQAYEEANRSIFLQNNMVVDAYRRALSRFEQRDKLTGKPSLAGKTVGSATRFLLPIIKVPTNIVAETMEYATGLVTGNARLGMALKRGIENLKPEEADIIMRQLKKGSLGAALMTLGFLNPEVIGGYYQPGERRQAKDVKAGHVKLYGVDIPSFLLHNPLLETLQLGATIRRVAESKLRKGDIEKQGIGSGVLAGSLGLAEQIPFLREMAEVSKAFAPHQRGAFFGELGKSVIPIGLQQAAAYYDKNRYGETTKRQPRNVWEHIEMGIPGLRENVPAKPNQR